MSPEQVLELAPRLALILLGFALLFLLLSLRFFRRSRKDVFWRRRRAAGQQGWRTFILSSTLLLFSGILCAITVVAPRLLRLSDPATTITGVGTGISLNPTADLTLTAIFAQPTAMPLTQAVATESGSTPTTPAIIETATIAAPPVQTTQPPATPEIAATQVEPSDTASATLTVTPIPPSASPTLTDAPPSLTPTARRTNTPTLTLTVTATATASATPSLTFTPTVTPTATPSRTATATATASITPTTTPTPSATHTPTSSATPTPSSTPSATATATETWIPIALPAMITSNVTPSAGATITITALDSQISLSNAPLLPATQFPVGTTRIYFFVEYSAMTSGMLWRRELWLNGAVIQQGSFRWGQSQAGTTFFYFGEQNGFGPGEYDIRLYIGDDTAPIATAAFSVQ